MHIRLAVAATASHRSVDADLKELHRHFQAVASSPEGPAALSVFRTVLRIGSHLGWGWVVGVPGVVMADYFHGCFGGCFFFKTSLTVSGLEGLLGSIRLSRQSGPLLSSFAIRRSAALTFPSIISLAKMRAVCLESLF